MGLRAGRNDPVRHLVKPAVRTVDTATDEKVVPMTVDMMALLRDMVEHSASDLHVKVDCSPAFRIDGELVPRLILPLSLSYDHRVIDGADAARFTTYLKQTLSDVRNLVL